MWSKWLRTLHLSIFFLRNTLTPRQFILLSSVFVGISSALAVVILKTFAHQVYVASHRINSQLHFQYLDVILPIAGIVLTVAFTRRVLDGKLEKGTWRIIYAITKRSSIMPRAQMYAQILTSSITVGLGGSAGLESPVTITGAAFGSNYARTYLLSAKERTLLLACGVAGGIAAAFNAPIAGVLFTLEVLLADVGITAFIPLMLAAASGALLSAAILNESILLSFKSIAHFELKNVPFYIVLGIATGLISVYHSRMFNVIETWFEHKKWGVYKKAFFGAVILAGLILVFPSLFGEGYESIRLLSTERVEHLLDGSLFHSVKAPWFLLLFLGLIIFAKAIATGVTLGAGGNGGNFAPSLFVGSYAGFVFSYGWNLTGLVNLPVSNFTMVGMAGMLSGLFHAPLTAIFLIAEITGGYELMIPLMIVSSISFALSKRYIPHSMDIVKLVKDGHVVRADKDRHVLSSIEVKDLSDEVPISLTCGMTMPEMFKAMQDEHQAIFPVLSEGKLVGLIYMEDLPGIIVHFQNHPEVTLDQVMESLRFTVTPRNNAEEIMEIFERSKMNYLPIVDHDTLIGYYAKSHLLEAYRKKIMDSMVE